MKKKHSIKLALSLIVLTALITIIFGRHKQPLTLKSKNLKYLNICHDTLIPHLLFKIPKKTFWIDKKNIQKFWLTSQYDADSGYISPFSVSVEDSIIYIPNKPENMVFVYSLSGELLKKFPIPIHVKPNDFVLGYFDVFPNGNYIIINSKQNYVDVFDPKASLFIYGHKCAPKQLKILNNDFVFEDRTKICDMQEKFKPFRPENYFPIAGNDFTFNDSNIIIMNKHTGNRNDNMMLCLYNFKEQETRRFVYTDSFINFYNSLTILNCPQKDDLLFVLGFANDDRLSMLCHTDLRSGVIKKSSYLKQTFVSRNKFQISGNLQSWPDGIVYYYKKEEDRLYGLVTSTDQYIYVFYYDLNNENIQDYHIKH